MCVQDDLGGQEGGPWKAHFRKPLNLPLFEILIIMLLVYNKQKSEIRIEMHPAPNEKTQIIYMLIY